MKGCGLPDSNRIIVAITNLSSRKPPQPVQTV
nr:MAG TPA: hypothetical protein [Caudoviricetes sp.]